MRDFPSLPCNRCLYLGDSELVVATEHTWAEWKAPFERELEGHISNASLTTGSWLFHDGQALYIRMDAYGVTAHVFNGIRRTEGYCRQHWGFLLPPLLISSLQVAMSGQHWVLIDLKEPSPIAWRECLQTHFPCTWNWVVNAFPTQRQKYTSYPAQGTQRLPCACCTYSPE